MNAPENQIQQQKTPTNLVNLQEQNSSLLAQSYSHREAAEGKIVTLQNQLEDSQKRNVEFFGVIEELTIERDCLQREIFRVEDVVRGREKELLRRIDDGLREKECLEVEIYEGVREREGLVRKIDLGLREKEGLLKDFDVFKGKNEELEDELSRGFGLIKECLMRVNERFSEKNLESGVDHEGGIMEENTSNIDGNKLGKCKGMEGVLEDLDLVSKMAKRAEEKLLDHGEKEGLLSEIEAYKCRNNELRASLSKGLEVLGLVKESLKRINKCLDENNLEIWIDQDSEGVLNLEDELERLMYEKLVLVSRMAKRIEDKMKAHLEKMKKEKQELERNVMSLTEENRDAIALLRIALNEKQEMEKSASKLKDSNNNEQWRVPLLQFAERGLQRVGFGFMIGGPSNEEEEDQKKIADQNSEFSDIMSDVSSECEEEVFSLASTVEKMMKNLRIEITWLRRDFDNSRMETERLQSLMEKQTLRISELTIYTNELEDRERILMQNVEELLISIKATEEEVERWRKACELEVEAGKHVAQEHNYLVTILKQELEKTRTTLQVSEKKLKLKEEVAVAAIAAQSAAERSVQLADARVARLLEKIEELTTQVEEAESKHKKNRSRRRMCWPWHALNSSVRVQNFDIRQTLPEMQAFIQ